MEKDLKNIEELKKNPFKTPENYFSKVEDEFWQSISCDNEIKPTFSQRVIPSLAMGLSFVFIFLLGFGVIKLLTPQQIVSPNFNSESLAKDNISIPQTIIDYLGLNEDIANNDLEDLYIEFFDEEVSISFDEISVEDNISDDEIIEYLSMSMSADLVYDIIENEN